MQPAQQQLPLQDQPFDLDAKLSRIMDDSFHTNLPDNMMQNMPQAPVPATMQGTPAAGQMNILAQTNMQPYGPGMAGIAAGGAAAGRLGRRLACN